MDNSVFFRLKNERLRLNLGQSDIANATDVSLKTVQRWEKEIAIPSDKLAVLANFGIDIQYVITGQRSSAALSLDEAFILDKIRQASLEPRNKILMLLLGSTDATSNVVSNKDNTVQSQQVGDNNHQETHHKTSQKSSVKVKKNDGNITGIHNG